VFASRKGRNGLSERHVRRRAGGVTIPSFRANPVQKNTRALRSTPTPEHLTLVRGHRGLRSSDLYSGSLAIPTRHGSEPGTETGMDKKGGNNDTRLPHRVTEKPEPVRSCGKQSIERRPPLPKGHFTLGAVTVLG
jgi:hypothetical protein